jgi:hypothetical protein
VRICKLCLIEKPLNKFDANRWQCRPEADKKNVSRWRLENPEKVRSMSLMYSYGLTVKKYNTMLTNQNAVCAICGSTTSKTNRSDNFYVDHDHATGKVRGLLCSPCNTALGLLEDNVDFLMSAVSYLMSHNTTREQADI